VTALAPALQAFFTDRLIAQRQVSSHTIAAYRDTFRLLLAFAQARTGTAPATCTWTTSTPTSSEPSWSTCATAGTTARAPATRGWPRSTHCSATLPCATPSTQP
jgi:site-specific recombinase XerC